MENEGELAKDAAHDTDGGFSEKKMALAVDRIVKSHQSQLGSLLTQKKSNTIVFQAQKSDEK